MEKPNKRRGSRGRWHLHYFEPAAYTTPRSAIAALIWTDLVKGRNCFFFFFGGGFGEGLERTDEGGIFDDVSL
jgi:hypothetical protein